MIINESATSLIDYQEQGDRFTMTHAQRVDGIKDHCALLRNDPNRGFFVDRTAQHHATIPMIEWLKHPEWFEDIKLVSKWLETEEGKPYKVVRDMRTTHAGIIVK